MVVGVVGKAEVKDGWTKGFVVVNDDHCVLAGQHTWNFCGEL